MDTAVAGRMIATTLQRPFIVNYHEHAPEKEAFGRVGRLACQNLRPNAIIPAPSSTSGGRPGRPKTDGLDAVWLAKLTERGILRPSFVPPALVLFILDLLWLCHARALLTPSGTGDGMRGAS